MNLTLPLEHINRLPLFAWANGRHSARYRSYPPAVRLLARRYRLPVRRAALIAELAGFPVEGTDRE